MGKSKIRQRTLSCLAVTVICACSFLVALVGCGGGGGGGGGDIEEVTPQVTLKLIRLDGTKLELSDRPIPLRIAIEATFSVPMNTSSVEGAISLIDPDGNLVAGVFSWNSDNAVMTLTPSSNLRSAATYRVQISANAVSASVSKGAIAPLDQSFITMTKCDVDGDSVPDGIVGAPYVDIIDISGFNNGQAYVFSGSTFSGIKATADAVATINGAASSDRLGWSVSCAGDVNGDGYEDIIVGALNADAGGTDRGQAYVFSGATLSGTKEIADAIAVINGAEDNDLLGASVSGAGDVNGDGYEDIIVGALKADAGGTNKGQAYVFSGATLSGTKASTDADAIINGSGDNSLLSFPVSGAGDVDNDGYADVIVGAPKATGGGTNRGQAYVFSGATLSGTKETTDADAVINGAADDDNLGLSVSCAGDVDGDGYADVIVGSPNADAGGTDRGRSYVFNGATLSGTKAATDADAIINGAADDDGLGWSVSCAGDVNGDGHADVIVGSPMAAGGGANRGQAYLFSGATLSGTKETTDADAIINGAADIDLLGNSVSGVGDVNGDGYADIIIGAYWAAGGGTKRGQAYLFSGATLSGTKAATDADAIINGAADGDWLGNSVSGAVE